MVKVMELIGPAAMYKSGSAVNKGIKKGGHSGLLLFILLFHELSAMEAPINRLTKV